MAANRTVICGRFKPVLEEALAREVSSAKEGNPLAPVLVLVGSRVLALHLDRALAGRLGAHANVRILTLHDFCRRLAPEPADERPLIPAALRSRFARVAAAGLGERAHFHTVVEKPGFTGALLATFDDLEQACFEPPEGKSSSGGAGRGGAALRSTKVGEVLRLFADYRSMVGGSFIEDADVIASAVENVGYTERVFGTGHVIVYGIYDLTELQKRLIGALADALDVTFMLPFEDRPEFNFAGPVHDWLLSLGFKERGNGPGGEAVAQPGETKAGSRREGAPAAFEERAGGTGGKPVSNLESIKANFGRPTITGEREPEDDGTVAVISAPGEAREVREIAREILSAARDRGVPFQDMAVILRSPDTYIGLIREEFDRLAIPYYTGIGGSLADTPDGRSLLALAALTDGGFSRDTVMGFLHLAPLDLRGLTGISDPDDGLPDMWNKITADAGIVRGRTQWEERLASYIERGRSAPAARESPQDETLDHSPSRAEAARLEAVESLHGVCKRLFDGIESIPASGPAGKIIGPLLDLYTSFTIDSPGRAAVIDATGEITEAEASLGALPREEALLILSEHLSGKTTRKGGFRSGGVNVLSLMEARGTSFRLVFVPGLVEKMFPAFISEDPILLDGEREALNAAGPGRLTLKRDRSTEERLLFTLASWMAEERLVLSYPRLDPGNGRPRIPSFYLLQAAEAFTGWRVNYERLEAAPGFSRVPLLPGSHMDPAGSVSLSEFRTSLALSEDPGRAEAARRYLLRDGRIKRARTLIDSRYGKRRFTEFEGLVPEIGPHLVRRDRPYSATELESYTACPYRYFHQRVLRLEKFEEPEEVITIDPPTRGSLVHEILRNFFERCAGEGLLPLSADDAEEHLKILRSAAREVFSRAEREGNCGLPALWERETAGMMEHALLVLRQEYAEGGEFVPDRFEVTFGRDDDAPPVEIELPGSRCVLFKGRIDRIDISQDGRRLRVVDYKTGKVRQKKDMPFLGSRSDSPGLFFQGMVYLLGAVNILGREDFDEVTGQMYYLLPDEGKIERVTYGAGQYERHLKILKAILRPVMDNLEKGVFIPLPGRGCDYCDFRSACPTERAVIRRRKSTDPAMASVEALAVGGMLEDV